jgi:hypothetical protein
MSDVPSVETEPPSPARSKVRKVHSAVLGPTRRPFVTLLIVAGTIGLVAFLLYQFVLGGSSRLSSDVVELSRSIERVEELATLKSHLRFAVVVREQSGSLVVRRLADVPEGVGMSSIESLLFHDPTMIVELHGVATYGVRLHGIGDRMRRTDSSVVVDLPPAEVLDVKLVSADTRIVAEMKGLFRSSNDELLAEANRHGEQFVAELAGADSTLLSLASDRTRSLIALLVEQAGSRAEFRPTNRPVRE